MTMSIEHTGPKLEADQRLTPRERLEIYLKDQEPGSPRIQAIADSAELELVQSRINKKLSERRITLKESSEPKLMIDDILLEDLMQKTAIRETMRKRQFGVYAAEYNAALEGASSLLRDYYNREYNERSNESTNENDIREGASNKLLRDLWHINNKSTIVK